MSLLSNLSRSTSYTKERIPQNKCLESHKLAALIEEHLSRREFRNALELFRKLSQDITDFHLPGSTYVALTKACIKLKDVEQGHLLHGYILDAGILHKDAFVGCSLVDMYAKCGDPIRAQKVFDILPMRSVVSWTALITAYVTNGHGDKALQCFEQMQQEGLPSDAVTYTCGLKACSIIKSIEKGRQMYADLTRKGFEKDSAIGSTLVDMYSKCSSVSEAQKVFSMLTARNVVTWTALIAAYTDHGYGKEALDCFKRMRQEGVYPDAVTYICSLRACGLVKASLTGQALHAEISRKGLEDNLIVGSTLVDMYAKCGLLSKARAVFDKLPVRDVVLWTALLDGYAEHGDGEEALSFFEEMHRQQIAPSMGTFVCGLKACSNIGSSIRGQELHSEITRKGFERELLVGNSLVDVYAKTGRLPDARDVLEKLPARDVITWTALITGYAQRGKTNDMFLMFDRMVEDGTKPNQATFVNILNACNHAGLPEKAIYYYETMYDDYGLIPSLDHYTCMIDLLCRAGHTRKVLEIISKMPFQPGIIVWHVVLGACKKWGNVELAWHAFENAIRLDEKDPSTYVTMHNILVSASMQDEADRVEVMRVQKTSMD
ncbi:hypothetical protein KP509_28G018400 [Ceratopteris richardii]|uniref:Pentatricopeptide repeat-containing protein n=3 Tax=Ceratopteris richardii TaxID=49495 RepID=A0A8T2RA17_CERRI|nr:hypothetical protein KP509_28G018400 [Ceratopteris richardii]